MKLNILEVKKNGWIKNILKIGIFTTAGKYILKFLNNPDHMSDV